MCVSSSRSWGSEKNGLKGAGYVGSESVAWFKCVHVWGNYSIPCDPQLSLCIIIVRVSNQLCLLC